MTLRQRLVVTAVAAIAFLLGWTVRGFRSTPPTDGRGTDTAAESVRWTCSMHPQIQLPSHGDCPICGMELIPLTDELSPEDGEAPTLVLTPRQRARARVRTTPVERRFVEAEVRMVGKVEVDETRQATITAWVPGRLERLFVDFTGVQVARGEHMVQLYSPKLYAAQTELLSAQRSGANLAANRERLRQWGLTPEQIEEIEASGQANERMTIYAPMGGVVVERYVQQGAYVEEGTPIYRIADLSHLWVMLNAYESDLSWLRYGQDVSFSTEAYPGRDFHGTVAFIDPVLDDRTRTVRVRVNVDNPEGLLKPDMFVKALVRAGVAQGGRVMEPNLAGRWICPMHPEVVSEAPTTCRVCEMDLVTTESRGYVAATEDVKPLVIPRSAVLFTGVRSIVYVEVLGDGGGTFQPREVVLGPRAGDVHVVLGGLDEGERVVTQGNFKLDSALQIRAERSMMSHAHEDGAHDEGE